MSNTYKVPVYGDVDWKQNVVARVRYRQNLDLWDGHNWTNGGVGCHLGITKLRDGRYVLIHGTDWEGQRDYGEIVSRKEALDAILKAGCDELLETQKFRELKELLVQEEE